jgi:uncharacterized repeat protein (TIGR03943 family)
MTNRLYRTLQALALTLLGVFLLEKLLTGKLIWYIHQRFFPLTLLGIVFLLGMGQIAYRAARRLPSHSGEEVSDHEHPRSLWGLLILLIPLVFGWLLPSQPLSASALDSKGISTSAPLAEGGAPVTFEAAPDERNILDWVRMFNSGEDLAPALGQTASVIGFVYHEPRLEEGRFMVSRFAIVCCAADAFAIGMVVDWPQAAALPQDAWVKVKGTVSQIAQNGQNVPLIQATSVELVDPPDQPYLFP